VVNRQRAALTVLELIEAGLQLICNVFGYPVDGLVAPNRFGGTPGADFSDEIFDPLDDDQVARNTVRNPAEVRLSGWFLCVLALGYLFQLRSFRDFAPPDDRVR